MIYFITGGERSGKSRYAGQLALNFTTQPVYLATARKWDSDFENASTGISLKGMNAGKP